jgi:hypothetical protein
MSDSDVFDSRQLDAWSFFSCQLGSGNYTISSAEAPVLSGSLVVTAAAAGAPDQDPPSIVLTSDDQGKLTFLTPPPFSATEPAYVTFSYSSGSRVDGISYSIQIAGTGNADSRILTVNQLVGYCFQTAGRFIYKGYLLVASPPGSSAPPSYVLKQQGEIDVKDDAPPGDPLIVILDASAPQPQPVATLTGYPVSWQAADGSWYVVLSAMPSQSQNQ